MKKIIFNLFLVSNMALAHNIDFIIDDLEDATSLLRKKSTVRKACVLIEDAYADLHIERFFKKKHNKIKGSAMKSLSTADGECGGKSRKRIIKKEVLSTIDYLEKLLKKLN